MGIVRFDKIKDKIIELRGEKVIIDSEVAGLYGVETKRINEAVKNNTDRFPDGYIIEITKDEFDNLRSKIRPQVGAAEDIYQKPLQSHEPSKIFQLSRTKRSNNLSCKRTAISLQRYLAMIW